MSAPSIVSVLRLRVGGAALCTDIKPIFIANYFKFSFIEKKNSVVSPSNIDLLTSVINHV